MAFVFNLNQQAAVNTGKGGALASGVHKVTIQEAWLGETKNGNNTVDLELVSDAGERATVYGMCIDEKFTTGSENSSFGVWNELAIVCGMQTGAVAVMERTAYDGSKTNESSFSELVGKSFTVGLQIVHDVKKDGVNEVKRRSLYRAFYADGRSIAEVQAGEAVAKQSANLKIEDYVTPKCKAAREMAAAGGQVGAPAVGVAPVAPIAPVAPVVPVAAPAAVAPVQPAPVVAQPAPVQPVAQPAAQVVTQPAAAVAAGMPLNPLAGQL